MPLPAPVALIRLQLSDLAPPVFVRGVPEPAVLNQKPLRSVRGNPRPPGSHARALWTEGKAPEAHGRSIYVHVEIIAAARHAIGPELGAAGAAVFALTEIHTGFAARQFAALLFGRIFRTAELFLVR